MPEEYVMHFVAYPALVIGTPARHEIPGLRRWFEYTVDTDCALDDWEERANEDRSDVDWWRADWIEPEPDEEED